MLKHEIETAVAQLINKTLWGWSRAADMAIFAFGQRRMVAGPRGIQKEVGEYALHVQCAWRIACEDQTIVGSRDLYYPAGYSDVSEAVPPEFEWDRHPNRRDKLLLLLFENGTREFGVQRVEVGTAGALHLLLADGFYLDVLPDDSVGHEHWRLFRPGVDEPHLVVTASPAGGADIEF